jgi:hypothetical protein
VGRPGRDLEEHGEPDHAGAAAKCRQERGADRLRGGVDQRRCQSVSGSVQSNPSRRHLRISSHPTPGRTTSSLVKIGNDDPTLTVGLLLTGELVRRLQVVEAIDEAVNRVRQSSSDSEGWVPAS